MIWATGSRMRPEHDNVRELPILGTLDRHGKMAPALPESKAGLIADSFSHELDHLCRRELFLSVYPAQTIHAAHGLVMAAC